MLRSLGLRTRIAFVVGTGALLVALGVTLLLINTVRLHSGADATSRADTYLLAVTDDERLVVDAETGLRGYVITGRPLFLQPTRQAQAAFPRAQAALMRAARADGEFTDRAEALERAARAYMTGYVSRLARLSGHGLVAARSYATTLVGKHLVDGVRARAAQLERLVSARQRARQRAASRSAAVSTTEAIVVLVLVTLLTVVLGTLLGWLVLARERARAASEQTAAALRLSLLPGALPAIPHCQLAARFLPATEGEAVGGDFYDVFAVGDDQWAIVVGDVCGKGPQAAALTAMARWTLRSLAGAPVMPAEALRFLNRSMLNLDLDGRFITIAYLLISPGEQGARAVLACAGHPPGILVPAHGEPTPLPAHGALLGIWPEITLESCEVDLGRGDGIVLYTDGVSDPGPGPPRLPVQALRGLRSGADADALAGALESYALREAAPQRDDIAIVAVRLCEQPSGDEPPEAEEIAPAIA
jgi:serine phosphatase RsbU (regulator of sigma subunit)